MSLLEDLSKDKRVVLYAVAVALAIISIGFFGLKFGLDLEGQRPRSMSPRRGYWNTSSMPPLWRSGLRTMWLWFPG